MRNMNRAIDEFDIAAEREGNALRVASQNRINNKYKASKNRFTKTKHLSVTVEGRQKFNKLFR